jgi:hypothetical protein
MRSPFRLFGSAMVLLLGACSGKTDSPLPSGFGGTAAGGAGNGAGSGAGGATTSTGGVPQSTTGGGSPVVIGGGSSCSSKTCAELGWACGYILDECEHVIDCAKEGLACASNEVCIGGVMGPTECVAGGGKACVLCSAIPDCKSAGDVTHLSGRVVTPGRDDANAANQIGVPNAIVYILQTADPGALPAFSAGIPANGTSCDRCEDQDLGPVLNGTVTDATGHFTLNEFIPVGQEFLLVVKAGRFRRATKYTLPASAACQTTTLPATLPDNPARLPRSMTDGSGVNIPRIAVTTGRVDAMECVLEKMGLAHSEFSNPATPVSSGAPRINLYRGGELATPSGASIDAMTPHDSKLYGDLAQLESYDILVSDCEGTGWDENFTERDANGTKVREFLNRGGRMFASHLSFSWLYQNGTQPYAASTAIETGLGPAGTWATTSDQATVGIGAISQGRPNTAPRVQNFSDWMVNEGITTAPNYTFTINEPRSMSTGLGPSSEEFVYLQDGIKRTQQFSFNTPYGAPQAEVCGRVAYSGFHVAVASAAGGAGGASGVGGAGGAGGRGGGRPPVIPAGNPFDNAEFPKHCAGDLTNQEKVLLYMLFDLGACIGVEPPPMCVPATCETLGATCGFAQDGCGNVLDCGPCHIR